MLSLAEAPALIVAHELSPRRYVDELAVPVVPIAVSNSANVAVIVFPEKAIDLFVNVSVELAVIPLFTFHAIPFAFVESSVSK
jgi:hypothetical protein